MSDIHRSHNIGSTGLVCFIKFVLTILSRILLALSLASDRGEYIKLGGRCRVKGPIISLKGEVYLNDRACAEDIYSEVIEMGDNCKVKNVYARHIIRDGCRVYGRIIHVDEVLLGHNVKLTTPPEKVKSLPNVSEVINNIRE